jgi:hypothetical protein
MQDRNRYLIARSRRIGGSHPLRRISVRTELAFGGRQKCGPHANPPGTAGIASKGPGPCGKVFFLGDMELDL